MDRGSSDSEPNTSQYSDHDVELAKAGAASTKFRKNVSSVPPMTLTWNNLNYTVIKKKKKHAFVCQMKKYGSIEENISRFFALVRLSLKL